MDEDRAEVEIRDHLERPSNKRCSNCAQPFGPDEVVIEREINATHYYFCTEHCYKQFRAKLEPHIDEE